MYSIILLIILSCFSSQFINAKYVSVSLDAKWSSTPFLLELSEFIAKDSILSFWSFVDAISNLALSSKPQPESERARYALYTEVASRYLDPQTAKLVSLALSLRAYSPAVAMQQSLAREHLLQIFAPKQSVSLSTNGTAGASVLLDNDLKFSKPGANGGDSSSSNAERSDSSLSINSFPQVQVEIPQLPCAAFVILAASLECNPSKISALSLTSDQSKEPIVYRIDKTFFQERHHSNVSQQNFIPVAILYGELGTKEHALLHDELKKLSLSGKLQYIFRHYIPERSTMEPARLSGYGVTLSIKSTEYKAKDDSLIAKQASSNGATGVRRQEDEEIMGFNFTRLSDLHPKVASDLNEFKQHLQEGLKELPVLKVWQLQDLGYQAAQKIVSLNGIDGLQALKDFSQNYPMRALSISKLPVKDAFRNEITLNQKAFEGLSLGAGDSALYVNGLETPELNYYDIFTMLDRLHAETKTIESLHDIGFHGDSLRDVIRINIKSGSSNQYALDFRDKSVQWLNDLEKDSVYRSWPTSIYAFLQPSFSMLRQVRRNAANLLLVLDPIQPAARSPLRIAEAFFLHQLPIRIGVVILPGATPESQLFAKMFYYIAKEENPAKAVSFITDIYTKAAEKPITSTEPSANDITLDLLEKHFVSEYNEGELEELERFAEEYRERLSEANEFIARIGLQSLPLIFVNGVPLDGKSLSEDEFENGVFTRLYPQLGKLQSAIFQNEVTDNTDIVEWIMQQPNVVPRLNPRVLSTGNELQDDPDESGAVLAPGTYLRFASPASFKGEAKSKQIFASASRFESLSAQQMASVMAENIKYLTKKDENDVFEITEWVVADFDSSSGQELAANAIKHLKTSGAVRIGFIHNSPSSRIAELEISKLDLSHAVPISLLMETALSTLSNNMAKNFLGRLFRHLAAMHSTPTSSATATPTPTSSSSSSFVTRAELAELIVHGMDLNKLVTDLAARGNEFLRLHQIFSSRALRLQSAERTVVSNGRVLGAFRADETFTPDDFKLLDKLTAGTTPMTKLHKLIKAHFSQIDSNQLSDLIMKSASVLLSNPFISTRRPPLYSTGFHSSHSVLHIPPANPLEPAIEIEAVVDPLSKTAQKLSGILTVLHQAINVNITIFMNPKEKLSQAPLITFYRFVFDSKIEFDESDAAVWPMAFFSALPEKALLTLGMDTPHSWMVESVRSFYDLDNIFLNEVSGGVEAAFELEYQLLEGHCTDVRSGQPPRGLQFTLGTRSNPVQYDTTVMANLGYFQLKAAPGAWILRIREGRSLELYEITAHQYTDSPANSAEVVASVTSFKSKIIRVKVAKRPGMERADLLSTGKDNDQQESFWSAFGFTSSNAKKEEEEKEKDDTLNIFSLASGHLYERLLRIMMLSVVKHTKAKVKFWFLKNFLSPQFKRFIPHMARTYGFEVELVQYAWPRWLHAQSEKQRIIWGYKILFLDVLFPLSLRKIIFVDADQVVRTDLTELRDLDLEGNPYGYTPFCESRQEMAGYRFWKTGYWSQHLGPRKYHISALYVVDLVRFRRIAAGDRLRGQYQGLSADPNSLSNLDQDLPNNMIHQVGIKSLPQHWLWCETWCSDEEKAAAKTIDLCNNPMTKEPKLTAATRIIAEWKDYDSEVRNVWDVYFDSNQTEQESTTTTTTTIVSESKGERPKTEL